MLSEEKENKQISISSSLKASYRSPLMMQKQAHNLSYVKGKFIKSWGFKKVERLQIFWKEIQQNIFSIDLQLKT